MSCDTPYARDEVHFPPIYRPRFGVADAPFRHSRESGNPSLLAKLPVFPSFRPNPMVPCMRAMKLDSCTRFREDMLSQE